MNITYRKLQPHHAAAYRAIRLEALYLFPQNFGSTHENESAKLKLAFENYIELQTPGKFIVGAFEGDTLIGICGFVRDEGKKNIHRGSIIQMYVKQQYNGKGIGLTLLNATVKEAFALPGVEQLALGVITLNTPAVTIYNKAGFTPFAVHHNYFKEDDGSYLHQQYMILHKPVD